MRSPYDSVEYYFGRRLEEAMMLKGVSADDLADFDICSKSSIREYITCGVLPNLRTACRLAEFLDVDLSWLCGFKEEMPISEVFDSRTAPWLT